MYVYFESRSNVVTSTKKKLQYSRIKYLRFFLVYFPTRICNIYAPFCFDLFIICTRATAKQKRASVCVRII